MEILIKKEIEQPINIPVPSFWRGNYDHVAVLNDNTAIVFCQDEYLSFIKHGDPEVLQKDILEAHNNYDLCPESEWIEAYRKVLKVISLEPVLTCENVQDKEAYQNLQNSITY